MMVTFRECKKGDILLMATELSGVCHFIIALSISYGSGNLRADMRLNIFVMYATDGDTNVLSSYFIG